MRRREQNSTSHPILFFMADGEDHMTGLTGLTPTVTISKDGGAFASAEGAVSEVGNGWYALAGDADDRDTLGTLIIHAEATGADTFDMDIEILASDPPTQEEIRAEMDSNSKLKNVTLPGWGLIRWPYLLTEPSEGTGTPISDARVWVCSDAAGANIIASGVTGADGRAWFWLDAGVVYIFRKKSGMNFINPDIETVS